MAARIEAAGRVGIVTGQDGAEETIRLTKDMAVAMADAHLRFFEVASRGLLFTASGAVGGVTHGTAFGTTPALALHNPQGSAVALVLAYFAIGYVSGTMGAGFYAIGQSAQSTVPTGGTAIATQTSLLNGTASAGRSAGRAYQGSTLAATPTILRPTGISYGAFAGGAGPLNPSVRENFDGEFILLPGSAVSFTGVGTAGTSPLLVHSCAWYEVPLAMATP